MRDHWDHFIDGEWAGPKAGRYLDSSNPANGELVTRIAAGDASDAAAAVEMPFGGYKQSGYGREKGIEALHHYTQLKSVTIRL